MDIISGLPELSSVNWLFVYWIVSHLMDTKIIALTASIKLNQTSLQFLKKCTVDRWCQLNIRDSQ